MLQSSLTAVLAVVCARRCPVHAGPAGFLLHWHSPFTACDRLPFRAQSYHNLPVVSSGHWRFFPVFLAPTVGAAKARHAGTAAEPTANRPQTGRNPRPAGSVGPAFRALRVWLASAFMTASARPSDADPANGKTRIAVGPLHRCRSAMSRESQRQGESQRPDGTLSALRN